MKGKHKATIDQMNRLCDIYKDRIGEQLGLTKKELMIAYWGEECLKWKGDKFSDRWKELSSIRRAVNKERLRNIRPIHFTQIVLDDADLKSGRKFGVRRISGYVYCQPLKTGQQYKNRMDLIAKGMEKSGEIALEEELKYKVMEQMGV